VLPFLVVYLVATRKPRTFGDALRALTPAIPAAAFLIVTFAPFLINDWNAFYDDVVRYNAGGAAWTYPISGMGFSALLLALGIIQYRQADFPFAIIEIAVAAPIAIYTMYRLWRDPTIARMLWGYALTLLAFLFFGRYFQGNYLGYILAVASPIPVLLREQRPAVKRRARRAVSGAVPAAATGPIPAGAAIEAPSLE
jgi:hypothetical protein